MSCHFRRQPHEQTDRSIKNEMVFFVLVYFILSLQMRANDGTVELQEKKHVYFETLIYTESNWKINQRNVFF